MQLPPLAVAAERICQETRDPAWGSWMATFCVRADMYPPAEVTEQLIAMRLRHEDMSEPVDRLLAYCRATDGPSSREDREAIQRLGRVQSGADDETLPPGAAAPKPN
jgi:hypothetical protein